MCCGHDLWPYLTSASFVGCAVMKKHSCVVGHDLTSASVMGCALMEKHCCGHDLWPYLTSASFVSCAVMKKRCCVVVCGPCSDQCKHCGLCGDGEIPLCCGLWAMM